MIILKYLDLILIVFISSYIGISKSKIFYKRVLELKNIKNSLNIFKSKIEFTYEPIREIFEEISMIVYSNNDNIFKTFCEKIKSNEVSLAWRESVYEINLPFTKEDREIIDMLGKMLGKTDKEGQISEIELVSNFLDKQIEDAEILKNKNEKLYKTLGIFAGLVIVIILV